MNPEISWRLRSMLAELESADINCRDVEGQEAVGLIGEINPKIVIMNYQLHLPNTVKTLRNISDNIRNGLIIVLMPSGEHSLRSRCREAGADFVISTSANLKRIMEISEIYAQQKAMSPQD